MHVSSILRNKGQDVTTIPADATIADAVALLKRRGIGALVVSGDGKKIDGILSERDVVRALADRGGAALAQTVGDLMSRRVTTCTPTDLIADLMGLMTEQRIRHLPVVDDTGSLAGIVSIGDVVKFHLGEIEGEVTSMREFIAGA